MDTTDSNAHLRSIPSNKGIKTGIETRPLFDDVIFEFSKRLEMTRDMKDALRVIYAVIITSNLGGDPLWVHIVSPPGGGKTELLMSCSECKTVVARSRITPASLVSGIRLQNGEDPSLIPKLHGKTFLLKDFTEILKMNKMFKDDIYGILRGAYDGLVQKEFGNGIMREYHGYFNMVSGTTPAIYADGNSVVGERFLMFKMEFPAEEIKMDILMTALANVGEEAAIRQDLHNISNKFLEWLPTDADSPHIPEEYAVRIANLATLTSMLRGQVERDHIRDYVPYRPSQEWATRIAKQLMKLLIGLSLTNSPPSVDANIYRIVAKTALDSCIGWNLDTIKRLIVGDGLTIHELVEQADIPSQTLRSQLDELTMLRVINKTTKPNPAGRGAPVSVYSAPENIKRTWLAAGLDLPLPLSRRPSIPSTTLKPIKAKVKSTTIYKDEVPREFRR